MEQKNLLSGLQRSLDEISEREVVLLQHPRQGKSLSAIFEFIEMISKSVEEGPKQSVKKVAIILGENSERNLKIVETIQNLLKDRPDLHIIGYNTTSGTVGSIVGKHNCFNIAVEYRLDFGCGLDKTITEKILVSPPVLEGYRAELAKGVSIMELRNYPVDIPEIQKSFDYQSGKRKRKYSKYHNNKFHNNKHYNNKLHK